jgi:sugar (pentulose or hexulose) kinase
MTSRTGVADWRSKVSRACFLVVDCSTSSCRASLVSTEGEVLAASREPVSIHSPRPGFAEVNPDEIWASVVRRVRELLARSGPADILALGVSAMVAYAFLGADSRPVMNAPTWMDGRGTEQARRLLEIFSERELYVRTGRRISPEYPALKLRWLAEHQPDSFAKVTRLVSLKDEIVRRFTGTVQLDAAHLNYSFLGNVRTGKPDADIVRALGLPERLLPEIKAPADIAGAVRGEAARATGLREGLPVIVGSSDGTSAVHAAGVYEPGASVLVSGTTDTFLTYSETYPEDPTCVVTVNNSMTSGGARGTEGPGVPAGANERGVPGGTANPCERGVPRGFLAGGAMGLSGGALQAVLALLGVRFEECEAEIGAIPPGSEGLLAFPGMTGERSPFWKDHYRGGIIGLTPRHGRAHVLRSLLEASAYRTAVLLKRLGDCGLSPSSVTVVGGGSESGLWNQVRADAIGLPLVALREAEATSLGTAVFCRVALDPSTSLASAARSWRRERMRYLPDPEKAQIYRNQVLLYERCVDAMDGVFSALRAATIR